jgi:hypothetical protein
MSFSPRPGYLVCEHTGCHHDPFLFSRSAFPSRLHHGKSVLFPLSSSLGRFFFFCYESFVCLISFLCVSTPTTYGCRGRCRSRVGSKDFQWSLGSAFNVLVRRACCSFAIQILNVVDSLRGLMRLPRSPGVLPSIYPCGTSAALPPRLLRSLGKKEMD